MTAVAAANFTGQQERGVCSNLGVLSLSLALPLALVI
jgi:hypothetical protein